MKKEIVIYQAKDGSIELKGDFKHDTIWATLDQIADIFGRDKSSISRHLKNIFTEGELLKTSVVAKNATTAKDGKTYMVDHYNLDVILSVGYRVNSKTATQFRQWATRTLKSYILDGFVINKKRISRNYAKFLDIVEDIKKLLPQSSAVDPKDAVELVSLFADTWLSLDSYDKEILQKTKLTKKKVDVTSEKISRGISELRSSLVGKGGVVDNFACERSVGAVSGIVGNVMQSFGGKELYPSVEEKAAHLLYFMVKNHPFVDGNKRSGAFAFVWFLKQAEMLDVNKITPSALTALTVLVAESDPKHKEKTVKLILNLLSK